MTEAACPLMAFVERLVAGAQGETFFPPPPSIEIISKIYYSVGTHIVREHIAQSDS